MEFKGVFYWGDRKYMCGDYLLTFGKMVEAQSQKLLL
jgi:hypothetical protein